MDTFARVPWISMTLPVNVLKRVKNYWHRISWVSKHMQKSFIDPFCRISHARWKKIFSFVEVGCQLPLRNPVLTVQCRWGFGTVIIIRRLCENKFIVSVSSAGVDSRAVFGISKIEIDESRTSVIHWRDYPKIVIPRIETTAFVMWWLLQGVAFERAKNLHMFIRASKKPNSTIDCNESEEIVRFPAVNLLRLS